jgi:hypothetical protein
MPASERSTEQLRRLVALGVLAAAALPAVITSISALTVCAIPQFISDPEVAFLRVLAIPLGIWFGVRVLLTSRMNLFADSVRLVAGALKGKVPHLVVTFLLVQAALFWLAYYLVVAPAASGCV